MYQLRQDPKLILYCLVVISLEQKWYEGYWSF